MWLSILLYNILSVIDKMFDKIVILHESQYSNLFIISYYILHNITLTPEYLIIIIIIMLK